MLPAIQHVNEIAISGIGIRTSNADEIYPSTAKIPGLWEKFFNDKITGKIRNTINTNITYGVYSNYESDVNGDYNLTAGTEVNSFHGNTEWKNLVIPSGDYLMFSGKGKMPEVVINTWKEVWNYFSGSPAHKRAYKVDFEKYVSNEIVEIYISIK